MSRHIAALPMYDWPEARDLTDAQWASIRDRLRGAGIDAPDDLTRRNGDMPAVPGGIRDAKGNVIAPDPATLPPDELDLFTLWRHPNLLLAQTCWGPMELTGLGTHVRVIGQPDYSDVEGGKGPLYSSVILCRRSDLPRSADCRPPVLALKGARLAFNATDSMSGFIALERDLHKAGASLDILAGRIETGSHRESARAVAQGRADICALDCRSWAMLQQYEPAAASRLGAAGWTSLRAGLPYVTRQRPDVCTAMRRALSDLLVSCSA